MCGDSSGPPGPELKLFATLFSTAAPTSGTESRNGRNEFQESSGIGRPSVRTQPKDRVVTVPGQAHGLVVARQRRRPRWTLILDDVLRRVSINHPPRTAAGLKNQVNHQSRLKLALVHAFAPHYPTTISLHPNTEALDASGNIVPFGTNLLMNFLTGELFLPSRTANQYLVRYCGSRYATVKIVHRSEIHHKSSPPRIEPQSGEWMDHGETGRVARAVRTGRVARDRANRTG